MFMGLLKADKVWAVLNERGIDDAEFARGIGESPQNVYNWKVRGHVPAGKAAAVARFLGLSLDKLLGVIDMPAGLQELAVSYAATSEGRADPSQAYVFVNKVRGAIIESGTGGLSWEHEEIDNSHAFQRDWINQNGWDVKRLKIFKNRGESNADWIKDGDAVLVHLGDESLDDTDDPTKNVFAIQHGDFARFKRLVPQHDGSILLRSYNSDKSKYPDELVEGQEIDTLAIIGKVVWRGG